MKSLKRKVQKSLSPELGSWKEYDGVEFSLTG